MVDVTLKGVSARKATAQALIRFPPSVAKQLAAADFRSKKGSIIDLAIVAGTMGAKKTADLIPLCHPLAIDGCDFTVEMREDDLLAVQCTVKVEAKTGVEMEALCGATVAALTVYDMCKALSHDIEIVSVKLLAKSGGKS